MSKKSQRMAEALADNMMSFLPAISKSAGTRQSIIDTYEPLLRKINKLIKSNDERIAFQKERWQAQEQQWQDARNASNGHSAGVIKAMRMPPWITEPN